MDKTDQIINRVCEALKSVNGIDAVVMGGSRAQGTHRADSDIDIGIYYNSALDLSALEKAAQQLDDEHRPDLIASPGTWGNWVNGGGWLTVQGSAVDLLLRDTGRVEQIVRDCEKGIAAPHYQTGHPHAFISAMYAGELAVCKLLWGTEYILQLKKRAEQYPTKLQTALVNQFQFEAGFSLALAEKSAGTGDRYYTAAHIVRSLSCLNQVLFALNRQYCINEKRAVERIEEFPLCPDKYTDRVNRIVTNAGADCAKACAMLKELIEDIGILCSEDI